MLPRSPSRFPFPRHQRTTSHFPRYSHPLIRRLRHSQYIPPRSSSSYEKPLQPRNGHLSRAAATYPSPQPRLLHQPQSSPHTHRRTRHRHARAQRTGMLSRPRLVRR
jgi:hypothetical protein